MAPRSEQRPDTGLRIDTGARKTGLRSHATRASWRVWVVSSRPSPWRSRCRSSASRPSIVHRVRTRYTVFCILRYRRFLRSPAFDVAPSSR